MSRKYPSMQEELAARKAAGEYGDLSKFEQRLYRNEPAWAKKSREDYERSRKISNGGAAKWSMRTASEADWTEAPRSGAAKQKSSPGKQKADVRKQKTPRIPRQKPSPFKPSVNNPRKGKTGCLIAVALLFVIFPLIGSIFSALGDVFEDYTDGYSYDYAEDIDFADDWENADGELDEYSSYTEAENYIFEQVAGGEADSEALNNLVFDAGLYDYLPDTASISTTDGYVVIWTECDSDDDPGEVLADLAHITEQYQSALNDNGYDDVPVAIIMKETEDWELRLVMADGTIYYASGDYADFVE